MTKRKKPKAARAVTDETQQVLIEETQEPAAPVSAKSPTSTESDPQAADASEEAPASEEPPASGEAPASDPAPSSQEAPSSSLPPASELLEQGMAIARDSERAILAAAIRFDDVETTVNVAGDMLPFPGRDDLDAPTVTVESDALAEVDSLLIQRKHLRGLLEALVFASDAPIKPKELAKLASAPVKQVTELLIELKAESTTRGVHLEEVAGGWVFRTSAQYAPFIRDLTKQRPVRLTRAQVETLAIIAYRQPITRPEVDDVRGVDSGPVLKLLLERDLVRILGKRDEPGRPLIYGTTTHFLEFFGLRSLKDLPTLREFTELTDESRERYEEEIGEAPNDAAPLAESQPGLPTDAAAPPSAPSVLESELEAAEEADETPPDAAADDEDLLGTAVTDTDGMPISLDDEASNDDGVEASDDDDGHE